MGSHDGALSKALDVLRAELLDREGLGGDVIFGPQLILSDEILDRIVQLGHKQKLPDVDALADQTSWRYTRQYGQDVLSVVHSFYPPPTSTLPDPPINNDIHLSSNSDASRRIRAPAKCTACGNLGHISSNQFCPVRTGQMVRAALAPTSGTTNVMSNTRSRTCGACGGQDHIASSKKCPKWRPIDERRTKRSGKENV
ncbi:hypothetical protein CVT26_012794 [Gymnopilus dilepis]|uniref:Zinc knuckle domain-containing protein n=1 Tax=Gymnopilus dilepis TaxID=231916 RepID=A0A409WDM4_9AGAR|nr:hypothetical protein CVT26_012794 [Gymnopilus dilepis]